MNGSARTSRAGSVAVAIVAGFGVSVIAVASQMTLVALVMGLSGLVLAGAILLRAGGRPAEIVVSTLMIPIAGGLELVGIGLISRPVLTSSVGLAPVQLLSRVLLPLLVGIGALAAVVGAASTLRAGLGEGATLNVFKSAMVAGLVFGAGVAGFAGLTRWDAMRESVALSELNSTAQLWPDLASADIALMVIGGLLAVFGYLGRRTTRTVPATELASHTYHELLATLEARVEALFGLIMVFGLLVAGSVYVGTLSGLFDIAVTEIPRITVLASSLIGTGIHWLLLGLSLLFGAILLLTELLQRATGRLAEPLATAMPELVGPVTLLVAAVGLAGLLPRVYSMLPSIVTRRLVELSDTVSPTGVVLLGLIGIVGVVAGSLIVLLTVGMLGLLPGRSSGSALAGAGLGLGGVAIALANSPPIAVFGVIGLAVVAWDIGEHGVTVQSELGYGSGSSIRVEAVHWAGSVGVALVGVLLAWMGVELASLLPPVVDPHYRLVAFVGAILGLSLLAGILRG